MQVISDYGKKVIVVINQSDLLERRDQAEVRRFVQAQIEQRLDLKPLIQADSIVTVTPTCPM